ncbi:MAG TPA: phytanoyl-CoA dioxygenase family protein [Kofleriaceae bacterium]
MLEAELEQFERDGFTILESVLDASALAEIGAALAPYETNRPMGRNAFEGQKSQRVYSLAAKGEAFVRLIEQPRVMALVERLLMPNFLLSTAQSIRLHPGEHAQAWHTDDAFYFCARPRSLTLAVSVIWAIEEFTEENGATEVIPGSHKWGHEHPDERDDYEFVPATMPAGSAIVFDGALWHRGGANRSDGTRLALSPQYCQPWLRPQESQLLIVPPDAARTCSDRMRSMLGYSIHPPFIGQVDGMHPLRLVDPTYAHHKSDARVIADRVLERPASTIIDS